jgi:hypothetical protein
MKDYYAKTTLLWFNNQQTKDKKIGVPAVKAVRERLF